MEYNLNWYQLVNVMYKFKINFVQSNCVYVLQVNLFTDKELPKQVYLYFLVS